ncbi:Hypothetical predicted protein [Xyrichtys novacula]|uniref:Uncharacterized protein n=1 Tax=Xyrichtys novacula TaxID=13765 RepID=A0AAV1GFK4_XYRNO|nr:Hypothetical predicted protein [Xyrichtys novacula]
MLLLTLLAGYLSLCWTQSTYYPDFSKETTLVSPFVESIEPTPSLPMTPSTGTTVIVVLRVAVRSTLEDLNETTVASALNQIIGVIQENFPGLDHKVELKKITRV